jgi:hypothetical protein
MDKLRAYILGEKNITMLENIIIDKLYELYKLSINRKDPIFKKNLMLVVTTIITDELQTLKTFDNKALVYINNIIIKETVGYLNSLLSQRVVEREPEVDFSSKLSEEDFFEELKIDNRVEQTEVPEPPLVIGPKYEEEVLIFDKIGNTKVDVKNVVSIELLSFSCDFSWYTVNETNCNFCIDNVEHSIKNGNYSVDELMTELTKFAGISFEVDPVNESVIVSQILIKEKKSMTGSIKQKENQKQVNIDFGVKNSIGPLLGFEPKTYILKDEPITSEVKHNIKLPGYFNVVIKYNEDILDKHTIITDVSYNDTIHYKPMVHKKIQIDKSDIVTVNCELQYNTMRPVIYFVKFTKMLF